MKPTEEQLNCIATAKQSRITKVNAVAGSGKTSTLVLMSKEIVEPSLYLAFNKVTAMEAAEKFPAHVTCRTTHSLAYETFGFEIQHKLSRPKGKYVNVAGTGGEIAKYYKIAGIDLSDGGSLSQAFLGLLVKITVQRYEQSGSVQITKDHLPHGELKDIEKKYNMRLHNDILGYAKKLWKDRTNLCSNVLATHDTYLKLWQLSSPQLPFKTLYLDEFQDANACVMDVAMNQKTAKLIVVGDNRQAIYGWRGAVNAMEIIEGQLCKLTKSFRYGQAIADCASSILGNTVEIEGREDIDSKVDAEAIDMTKPYAVLCRTNSYLLDSATYDIENGMSVAIEIDVKDFVKVLESCLELFNGNYKGVKHEKVIPYSTWEMLIKESKDSPEFVRIINIIKQGRAFKMSSMLGCYVKPDNPLVTYTTAHKSKGREFSQVVLASDFPSHYNKGSFTGLSIEEQNLLYVAATRAIDVLVPNSSCIEAMERWPKIIKDTQ